MLLVCVGHYLTARIEFNSDLCFISQAPNLNCPGFSSGGIGTPGLTIFVQLLCTSTNESVHRAALGVLVEVAQDRDSLDAIASVHGISTRLNELASSRNEAISTYAGTLIVRLTSTPPPQAPAPEDSPMSQGGHLKLDPLTTPPPMPMDTGGGGRMSPVSTGGGYTSQGMYQAPSAGGYASPHHPPLRGGGGYNHSGGDVSGNGGSMISMVGQLPPQQQQGPIQPASSYGSGGGCTQPMPSAQHQHCYQQRECSRN